MLRTRRVVLPVVVAVFATGLTPFVAAADPVAAPVVDDALPVAGTATETVPADERADLPDILDEVRQTEVELGLAPEVDEPAPGRRTAPLEAPITFSSLYVELPSDVEEVAARVSLDGEDWGPWVELEGPDPLEGPDVGSEEYTLLGDHGSSELLQADEARYVQLEVDHDVDVADLTVRFLDTEGLNEGSVARFVRRLTPRLRPAHAATVPSWVQPRSAWGAAPPRKAPKIAPEGVRQVVLQSSRLF